MAEQYWMPMLGLILVVFEVLFGAAFGLDVMFLGISFMLGSASMMLGGSWQTGIAVSAALYVFYVGLVRIHIRKKALHGAQRLGIDFLAGKMGVVITPLGRKHMGRVLVDGEVFFAKGEKDFKEDEHVLVAEIKNGVLVCVPLEP